MLWDPREMPGWGLQRVSRVAHGDGRIRRTTRERLLVGTDGFGRFSARARVQLVSTGSTKFTAWSARDGVLLHGT